MARFDGVPPNMSVSTTTPSPVLTRFTAATMSLRRRLHVVLGADGDGLDLRLRTDHMLERGPELRRELPVRDEHHSDHDGLGSSALSGRGRYFVHCEAKRKAYATNCSSGVSFRRRRSPFRRQLHPLCDSPHRRRDQPRNGDPGEDRDSRPLPPAAAPAPRRHSRRRAARRRPARAPGRRCRRPGPRAAPRSA